MLAALPSATAPVPKVDVETLTPSRLMMAAGVEDELAKSP